MKTLQTWGGLFEEDAMTKKIADLTFFDLEQPRGFTLFTGSDAPPEWVEGYNFIKGRYGGDNMFLDPLKMRDSPPPIFETATGFNKLRRW